MDYYYKKFLMYMECTNNLKYDLEDIKKTFKYNFIKKGTHLTNEGDVENKISFVCEGMFRYYYITANGEEITKHFTVENDFATSYASLIYQRPTKYSIIADEDCHILSIDYKVYNELIEKDRSWERLARKYTEHIYNLKELREASFLLLDAETRYKEFLNSYKKIESRLRQKDIATYLGINPVSLSRIRKNLKT